MENFIQMFVNHLPWVWLSVMVLCIIIEAFTMGLTTIWFGCGALVMVFLSLTPLPFRWQLLFFVVISCVLLITTRPLAIKKFAKKTATNSDSLIGKKALVSEKIEQFKKGSIKINGIQWTAKTVDDSIMEEGKECKIVSIEGVTAIVMPI